MGQITQAELANKYGFTRAQIAKILIDRDVKCVGYAHGKNPQDRATHIKMYEEREAVRAIIAMYNGRKREHMQRAAEEAKNAARIAEIFRAGREPKP